MMAIWLNLLFMPVCAAMAGLVLWMTSGRKPQEDSDLLRGFIFLLGSFMLLYWGAVNTETVRLYTDPQFRLQKELDSQPVYAAIRDYSPDEFRQLHDFLVARAAEGVNVDQAFLLARNLLTGMASERLGFTDQQTHLVWGRTMAGTLRELQAKDPLLCYRAMARQPLPEETLLQGFSAGNTLTFQQAVVALYAAADRGMRHQPTAGEVPVSFDDAAREFRRIQQDMVQQFGDPVMSALATRTFPAEPVLPAEQLCAARIFQLDAMLARPQAMAARLLDSVLR
jgi:hypothetical protein